MSSPCPHCNKMYKNVELHITKMHADFTVRIHVGTTTKTDEEILEGWNNYYKYEIVRCGTVIATCVENDASSHTIDTTREYMIELENGTARPTGLYNVSCKTTAEPQSRSKKLAAKFTTEIVRPLSNVDDVEDVGVALVKQLPAEIRSYEARVRACFKTSVARIWYGGEDPKRLGTDPNKMYIALEEDEHWYANCCVLRSWFFDYEAFDKLNLDMDCANYGVYVVWRSEWRNAKPEPAPGPDQGVALVEQLIAELKRNPSLVKEFRKLLGPELAKLGQKS